MHLLAGLSGDVRFEVFEWARARAARFRPDHAASRADQRVHGWSVNRQPRDVRPALVWSYSGPTRSTSAPPFVLRRCLETLAVHIRSGSRSWAPRSARASFSPTASPTSRGRSGRLRRASRIPACGCAAPSLPSRGATRREHVAAVVERHRRRLRCAARVGRTCTQGVWAGRDPVLPAVLAALTRRPR